MKWIKISDRLPKSDYVDTFFVKQRIKDSDEDWFPGTCTYSGEWEISEDYEVVEWLDESPSSLPDQQKSLPEGGEGVRLIAEERKRQVEVEGWDNPHDEDHQNMELSGAAACYVANAINKEGYKTRFQIHLEAENGFLSGNTGDRGDRSLRKAGWYDGWPWDEKWDKRKKHDVKRSLVIAGALIAAELDRLNVVMEKNGASQRKLNSNSKDK